MRNVINTITLSMFVVSTAAPYILQGGTAVAAPKPGSAKNALTARADIEKTLGFVPGFFQTMADPAVSGAWEEMKGLQLNPNTALTGKTKELIGLAVSAQIPCHYCIYAHTEFAKLNGASEAVIAEAVAVGALERHWSAYLFGMQVDETKFRSDIARLVAGAKNPGRPQSNVVVVDARTAAMDIEQTLGFFPELLRAVPEYALPGAWREMKELKLNPNTLLNGKEKALIALAVASQVPSRPCVFAETEFAKLAGAAQREIAEAVGMAAITRNMSTLLNGQQVDERAFREDIDHLVSGAKAAQRKASSMGRHPSAAAR
jgi:AhpD family alkylhydroperoxidase